MVEETAGLLASISTLNNGPTTQLLTALVPLPTPGSAPDLSFPRSLPAEKADSSGPTTTGVALEYLAR
jgi:hypothetical protein